MIKRIITGLLLVALVLLMFYLRTIKLWFFDILIYVCAVVGTIEITIGMGERLTLFQRSVAIAFSLTFAPVFILTGAETACVVAFSACLLLMLSLVIEFNKVTIESVGLSLITLFYPTLTLFPIMLTNSMGEDFSTVALLMTFAVAPMTDTMAYFVGSLIGGKKLSQISPKKTVSGAIGGLFGGAIASVAVWALFGRGLISDSVIVEVLLFVIAGFSGAALAEFGDLLEGAIKRKLGIKDMGKILPGHGGVLDRIDGIMLNGVFIYLFFSFLAR